MTNKDFVLKTMKQHGKNMAIDLQKRAPEMEGTELYSEISFIPNFNPEKQYLNYPIGYVCKSPSGRLVKLLQPYDSTIFIQEPEELTAQWGFYWSKNIEDALPFVSIATSPYMVGDCCEYEGIIYRSLIDNNTWSPIDYAQGWEFVELKIETDEVIE